MCLSLYSQGHQTKDKEKVEGNFCAFLCETAIISVSQHFTAEKFIVSQQSGRNIIFCK